MTTAQKATSAKAGGPRRITVLTARGFRVGATHRKLSTILNALFDAGLEAERFVGPPTPVPTFLLWRCGRR